MSVGDERAGHPEPLVREVLDGQGAGWTKWRPPLAEERQGRENVEG